MVAVEATGRLTTSTWAAVVAAEPDFAGRVRRVFDLRRHKTLATLRRDGSPRISGIELEFVDGDVVVGMMSVSARRNPGGADPLGRRLRRTSWPAGRIDLPTDAITIVRRPGAGDHERRPAGGAALPARAGRQPAGTGGDPCDPGGARGLRVVRRAEQCGRRRDPRRHRYRPGASVDS